MVLNLQTGSIMPQYHVVFDDYFSTVSSVERELDPPEHWADLCLKQTTYIQTDDTENGAPTSVFLDDDWLTPEELEVKQRSTTQDTICATFADEPPDTGTTSAQSTTQHTSTDDVPDLVSETTTTQQREPSMRAVQREPSVPQHNINREPSTTQRDSTLTAPPAAAVPTPT